jgi:hypothetical protein
MTNRSVTMALLAGLAATLVVGVVGASDEARVETRKSSQAFMGYWLGYVQGGAPLQATPAPVGIVALAFAVTSPGPDGDTITLDFLTSQHSAEDIRAGVKALQARGVKVVMSINGKPNWIGHARGWDNLDPAAFAANVKAIVVDQWGLDGVDLDNEAGSVIPGDNFVQVVKALRHALGPDALLTLPVFWAPGVTATCRRCGRKSPSSAPWDTGAVSISSSCGSINMPPWWDPRRSRSAWPTPPPHPAITRGFQSWRGWRPGIRRAPARPA